MADQRDRNEQAPLFLWYDYGSSLTLSIPDDGRIPIRAEKGTVTGMPDNESVTDAAAALRAILLALPEHERPEALHATGICLHCGHDENEDGYNHPCQCWNDE